MNKEYFDKVVSNYGGLKYSDDAPNAIKSIYIYKLLFRNTMSGIIVTASGKKKRGMITRFLNKVFGEKEDDFWRFFSFDQIRSTVGSLARVHGVVIDTHQSFIAASILVHYSNIKRLR